MPLWLKIVDAMADNGPIAPKKPADLRYVTLPTWTQPVSLYLLERIEGDKVWFICRPALDSSQETEPQFQLPDEEEGICFERVDFSTLSSGDEHPLGQPGVKANAIMFDFLICEEASPYTRTNMLAVCPSELRAKPKSVSLSPGAGRVEMGNGGGASMPQTPDPGVGETTGRDKLDKLLATVEGMATQLTGVVSRVAKLENPPDTRGSARRETRRGTVFFDEEEEALAPPLPLASLPLGLPLPLSPFPPFPPFPFGSARLAGSFALRPCPPMFGVSP